MDVFILKYDVHGNDGCASEILGVFSTLEKASAAFSFYLDEIEKVWREEDGEIGANNTFNRFSEPNDDLMANATCIRFEEPHMINVTRYAVE